jgi:hypothetical protein
MNIRTKYGHINKMECQFCKKTFSSKSALNAHQKTDKYCLKIQGKELEVATINTCACTPGRVYKCIKQHYRTQKHKSYELLKENRSLRLLNKKQENEICALKRVMEILLASGNGDIISV